MKTFLATISLCLVLLPTICHAVEISSPDRRILLLTHFENGQIAYSVEFDGKPIIGKSRVGVELKGGAFSKALTVSGSKTRSHDETWKPVWGQFRAYRDHYNEITLDLAESAEPNRTMQVIFRVYNDGIGFRYVFPKQNGLKEAHFGREFSSVSIVSKDPVAWFPRSSTGLSSNVHFDELKKACRTPFTVQLSDDCFVSLHEAAVVNSSDAMLSLQGDKRTLAYSSKSKQDAGPVSAWRTIQIASSPAGLIESSLLLNLNEPSKLVDTSWIKPGVSLWDEWHLVMMK